MKAELIIPIETLRGKLNEDGFYFRVCNGAQIVQSCPRKWKDTAGGKKTMRAYLWKVCGDAYDAALAGA